MHYRASMCLWRFSVIQSRACTSRVKLNKTVLLKENCTNFTVYFANFRVNLATMTFRAHVHCALTCALLFSHDADTRHASPQRAVLPQTDKSPITVD